METDDRFTVSKREHLLFHGGQCVLIHMESVGENDVIESRLEGSFPVEYRRGKRKRRTHHEVQLCAEPLHREELLGLAVTGGAIYFGAPGRRVKVGLDERPC